MKNNEYISSGVLELYAAGLLTKKEESDVEAEIRNDDSVRAEYESIVRTINLAAFLNLKTPSDSVKKNILESITGMNTTQIQNDYTRGDVKHSRSYSYRYLMAACISFLILSLAGNYFLWKKLKFAETENELLSDQRKVMVQEIESVNKKLSAASKDMDIMTNRSYMKVEMNGLEKSPDSRAVAYWNPASGKLYVVVSSLPVPPRDKQYQLWGISNGKPFDAGVMDVDPSDKNLHEMKNLSDAQAFAITLEPKGGSASPTMDQMYLMGKL